MPLITPTKARALHIRAGVLAIAAMGLIVVIAMASVGPRRSVLDYSEIGVNCDGSVDITTYASAPCPAGIVPTTLSYTSYAPPLAPTVLAPPPVQPYGALPVGPNVYQYPTIWSGDSVLSGGQPEWAAEDAAQHALNLNNWRIKILDAKKQQARLNGEIERISGSFTDGPGSRSRARGRDESPQNALLRESEGAEVISDHEELNDIRESVANLASETTRAIAALSKEMDKEGKSSPRERRNTRALRRRTDEKMDSILRDLGDVAEHNEDDAYFD